MRKIDIEALEKSGWYIDSDDDGNPIYHLVSPYHDQGLPFEWVIKLFLADGKIYYHIKDSTEELITDLDHCYEFSTLWQAKQYCERENQKILKEENVIE